MFLYRTSILPFWRSVRGIGHRYAGMAIYVAQSLLDYRKKKLVDGAGEAAAKLGTTVFYALKLGLLTTFQVHAPS